MSWIHRGSRILLDMFTCVSTRAGIAMKFHAHTVHYTGPFAYAQNSQDEYVRVAMADDNLMDIGSPQTPDREFLCMLGIFATGLEALNFSGFQPGDSVAILSAGPVGLLCTYSAKLRGASKVYSIDHVPARLAKVKVRRCRAGRLHQGRPPCHQSRSSASRRTA